MLLKGQCKGCGETIKLDVGNMTLEQVVEKLEKMDNFVCPGHHTEHCSPYPSYWEVDKGWVFEEGQSMTEEEFVEDLRSKFVEVRDTTGMSGLITSFAFGEPMTNDGHTWSFCSSPKGKRWYYRLDK